MFSGKHLEIVEDCAIETLGLCSHLWIVRHHKNVSDMELGTQIVEKLSGIDARNSWRARESAPYMKSQWSRSIFHTTTVPIFSIGIAHVNLEKR